MKNIKINTNKLIIILVSGFILVTSVACSNEKADINNNSSVQEYNKKEDNYSNIESQASNNTNGQQIEVTSTESNTVENKTEQNNTVENSDDNNYTSNDKEIIHYFNDVEESVDKELKNSNENTKDKLKGTFITIVDFLFYDSEINGIKFDDLTEGAKQNILETVSSIDNKIMTKYPNYKDEISTKTSSAYNKASDLIKKGANNIKEFSKEKLGEENYNAIVDAKDELVYYTKTAFNIIGDVSGSIWETGKSKIKTWYENFRNR